MNLISVDKIKAILIMAFMLMVEDGFVAQTYL